MPYFGLNGLDQKLERFVDFDGGVFFEAGANDGLAQSNTAHFEFDRGWTGILVEPIPTRYREARANRPNATCLNAALVADEAATPQVDLRYCNLMTVTLDERSVVNGEKHVEKGLAILRRRSEEPYNFTAPGRTISSILDQCGITQVDLLSIDLEGFEHVALRGLDLRRHSVRCICVEARLIDPVLESLQGRYTVAEKLSHHDYLLVQSGERSASPIARV